MLELKRSKSDSTISFNDKTALLPVLIFREIDSSHVENTLFRTGLDVAATDQMRSIMDVANSDEKFDTESRPENCETEADCVYLASAPEGVIQEWDKNTRHSSSLACMNTNSNGKVSPGVECDTHGGQGGENILKTSEAMSSSSVGGTTGSGSIVAKDKIKASAIKGNRCSLKSFRRVKAINMGEIPLQPVGLSLSGSGMELFVKVDCSLHREQLANLESQIVTQADVMKKPRKPARKKTERPPGRAKTGSASSAPQGKSVGRVDDDCDDVDDDTVFIKPRDPPPSSCKAFSQNRDTSRMGSKMCENSTGTRAGSRPAHPPQLVANADVLIKEEVPGGGEDWADVSTMAVMDDCDDVATSTRTDSAIASLDATNDSQSSSFTMPHDQTYLLGHSSSRHVGVTTAGKSLWRRPEPSNLRHGQPGIIGDDRRKKRPMPSVFTSNDLPLKRPVAFVSLSNRGNLVDQQRNNSGFFCPVTQARPGVRHVNGSRNNASVSSGHEIGTQTKNFATGEHDSAIAMSEEDIKERESSTYHLMDDRSSDSNPHRLPKSRQAILRSVTLEGEPSQSADRPVLDRPDQRLGDTMTPLSFDDFNPSQILASDKIDAATIAKFAQYTSSMRRDLKHNYKKLSLLMKDFSDEVMEHYREQPEETEASSSDQNVEAVEDMDSHKGTCVLM